MTWNEPVFLSLNSISLSCCFLLCRIVVQENLLKILLPLSSVWWKSDSSPLSPPQRKCVYFVYVNRIMFREFYAIITNWIFLWVIFHHLVCFFIFHFFFNQQKIRAFSVSLFISINVMLGASVKYDCRIYGDFSQIISFISDRSLTSISNQKKCCWLVSFVYLKKCVYDLCNQSEVLLDLVSTIRVII